MLKFRFPKGIIIVLAIVLLCSQLCAQQQADGVVILDTSSFWRCHYTLRLPVFRKGADILPLNIAYEKEWERVTTRFKGHGKWLERNTLLPPTNWTNPDFDDSSWCRMPGVLVASVNRRTDRLSPHIALECRRGKFTVTDPARAKPMTLSLEFHGGVIVFLNGSEIGRAYLPKGKKLDLDEPAQEYEPKEPLTRRLTDVNVPTRLLRKGVNILAVEVHRAPNTATDITFKLDYRRMFVVKGPKGALTKLRLTVAGGQAGALVPNVSRPKGMQVWNAKLTSPDFDLDYGDPNDALKPMEIVGTRNGVGSGKVVVGSDKAITGLSATASALVEATGKGSIGADRIQVRYSTPNGFETVANTQYLAAVNRFDGLSPIPPKEVPVREKQGSRRSMKAPGIRLVFGAVVPVWVTVNVPRDAVPGDYRGTLTIRAAGERTIAVPIKLKVCGWRLPHPVKFRTFVEVVQSPESVAMKYGVPFWSDKHFELLEESLKLLAQVGNKTAYVPLICETNLGNAQTMVRWIKQAGGGYKYDFNIMERYLDLVEKHQGKPAVVCFYVWEPFLGPKGRYRWGEDRFKEGHLAYGNRGPEVSLSDPATGKVTKLQLPRYAEPTSVKLWRPLLTAMRDRMKKRGWDDVMTFGLVSDRVPTKETVAFFRGILPKMPWSGNSHVVLDRHRRDGLVLKYQSEVYDGNYIPDPALLRFYGWKPPGRGRYRNIDWVAQFPRLLDDGYPLTTFRFLGEITLLTGYFGFSRMGADFWPVGEPASQRPGKRIRYGKLSQRYPKSSWSQLNIRTTLLEPGQKGAISTARFELLREGLQEAEARIFIEQAIDNKAFRAKLDEALLKKSQETLDARTLTIIRSVNTFIQNGHLFHLANKGDCWWETQGIIGYHWYLTADRKSDAERLYTQAARVAKALGDR